MTTLTYDSIYEDFEDLDYEKPKFESEDDALYSLIENLLETKYLKKNDLADAISYIAKKRKFKDYEETSAEDIELYCRQEYIDMRNANNSDNLDSKKRMLKSIKNLELELYGNESIDIVSIDSSLSNLSFHCGHYRTSNRNLNIKRKNVQSQNEN